MQAVSYTHLDVYKRQVLMFILKVGYILDTGFEQVLVFYNPAVYDLSLIHIFCSKGEASIGSGKK